MMWESESTSPFEYPHPLSNPHETLIRLPFSPDTIVLGASTIEERRSPKGVHGPGGAGMLSLWFRIYFPMPRLRSVLRIDLMASSSSFIMDRMQSTISGITSLSWCTAW